MRTMSVGKWSKLPSVYKEVRNGRYCVMLAGKMRPVMLIGAATREAETDMKTESWTPAHSLAAFAREAG